MSHSDSEIKDDLKDRIRRRKIRLSGVKKLRNCHNQTTRGVMAFKRKLDPIYQEIRFLRAVNTNNTDEVKRLLRQGVSPNSADSELRSALHLAVTKEFPDIVHLLLLYGADPNKRDLICNTPLHLAACIHNVPIITMLLNAKANVRSLDLQGRRPLDLAKSKLEILLKNFRNGSIEMLRLREELQQIVDLLISIINNTANEPDLVQNIETGDKQVHVAQLELMKLSLGSAPNEDLDDKMAQLLGDIQGMKI